MVAVIETPMCLVLPHITWETYKRILNEVGKTRFRISYFQRQLAFTTATFKQNQFSRWFERLIFLAAFELNIPLATGGSTTLNQKSLGVGIEPDECFWIENESRMRGKKKWTAISDPPPDLAVEIEISCAYLDRLAIYAALGVPEVWRFDGETLNVLILGANGKYKERVKSQAFPSLPMDGFVSFVKRLGSAEEVSLTREFTEWLRADVAKKPNGRK